MSELIMFCDFWDWKKLTRERKSDLNQNKKQNKTQPHDFERKTKRIET